MAGGRVGRSLRGQDGWEQRNPEGGQGFGGKRKCTGRQSARSDVHLSIGYDSCSSVLTFFRFLPALCITLFLEFLVTGAESRGAPSALLLTLRNSEPALPE